MEGHDQNLKGESVSEWIFLILLIIIWVDHEGSGEVARGEVVISARGGRLPARRGHAVRRALVALVGHHLLLCLVRGDPLLGHHGIVRVIQVVQFICDSAVLGQS